VLFVISDAGFISPAADENEKVKGKKTTN